MIFDTATLLISVIFMLILLGMTLAAVLKDARRTATGYWWISAFLLTALGFICLGLLTPSHPILRPLMNTAFLTGYACCYNGARTLAGRPSFVWPVLAALAGWPIFVSVWQPDFAARAAIFSIIVCFFTAATAAEFVRGAAPHGRTRYLAAALCALHAIFYAARAILGPTLGLESTATDGAIADWSAIISLEALPFAAILTILVISISLEQVAAREKIIANTDHLTGIGNRRAFDHAMMTVIGEAKEGKKASLLLLDLNKFKAVNDRLGHGSGDALLKAFTRVISAHLPDPATFWRLGGDEFAILVRSQEAAPIETLKDTLRTAINNAPAIREIAQDVRVSVSIGSAAIAAGQSLSQILKQGDAALYEDKISLDSHYLLPPERVRPRADLPN